MEVAVSISQGALGSLLKKLNNLLADECARLKGVRREIRSLRSELNHMNAALQKCSMLENPDIQVKVWTKEVRELAYDIEDCIDMFIDGVGTDEHHGPGGIKEFFRKSARRLKTLGTRHHIANQIKELKARVIEVSEQRVRYKLDEVASSNSSNLAIDPRLSALFVEEAHLVGIEGPRDDLVNWLVEGEIGSVKHRKVLSIFGFGGLGKTTLANEVKRKIGRQFDYQAFVSVSQKPDMKRILCDILPQLTKTKEDGRVTQLTKEDDFVKQIETWDEKRLIEKLRELLQLKRYIIIIDDAWSIAAWEQLKCVLPENNLCSRVITTTRIESVARACCSHPGDRCYRIEPLRELHSRNLFFKRIFGCVDGCPVQLKHVSAEILKKCGGLPLAIVSIASLLASKPQTKAQWEKVRASIGSALEKNPDLDGMKNILSLSYNDLPPYLKTCLLYLSIFPEDYVIERGSLVRRWIAEGFIDEEPGQSMEDVAESYFNELINRSMIQPVDIGYDGMARACRLHDMMLELITSKATQENFATILDLNQISSKPEGVVRRLSIQNHGLEHPLVQDQMMSLSHVRSLTIFGSHCNRRLPFDEFRVLRVLSIDGNLFEVADLKMICKLYQLKYLRLRLHTNELPTQIGDLQNLETLEIDTWDEELPCGVARLQKLRHLVAYGRAKLREGVGSMRALQTFKNFSICNSSMSAVQELGDLTNLRELSVSWEQAEPSDPRYKEYFINSLSKLSSQNLRTLSIVSPGAVPVDFLASLSPPLLLERFWMTRSYFQRCPKWIAPLNNLAELGLNVWEVEENDMHVLGELPALLHFELWVVALHKEKIVIAGTGFQSLKTFRMWSGLPCLTFEERSMPKLETLKLCFSACGAKSYGSTHSGIQHLQSLKRVQIEIFVDCASESDFKAAVYAIENAVNKHPKNPTRTIAKSSINYSDYGELTRVKRMMTTNYSTIPETDDFDEILSY